MDRNTIYFSIVFLCLPLLMHDALGAETSPVLRGRIHTSSGEQIEGWQITFASDSVEYSISGETARQVLNLSRIEGIQAFRGNRANMGRWIGAISGIAVGAALAATTIETEDHGCYRRTTWQSWPIWVFGTVGSFMGYQIGKKSETWETVYSGNALAADGLKIESSQALESISLVYTAYF